MTSPEWYESNEMTAPRSSSTPPSPDRKSRAGSFPSEPIPATPSSPETAPKDGFLEFLTTPKEPSEFSTLLDALVAQIPTPSNPVTWLAGEESVAESRSALLALYVRQREEIERLKAEQLTADQADLLLAVTDGLPEELNDKLIDIVEVESRRRAALRLQSGGTTDV